MAIEPTNRLKGITQIGKETISQNLLYGLIDFFQWGMLQVGGFQNITISPATDGSFGGDRSRLRPVKDPNYTDGQIWEGFRSDWVWETGIPIDFITTEPIRVEGIYIDGGSLSPVAPYEDQATVPGSVGYVDYPRGRVILDSAISTTSAVKAEFSHRFASFIPADSPWFREIQFNSYNVEDDDFLSFGSGNWSQLSETRRHLPFVAVEVVPRRGFRGAQLGGGQWIDQDVLFHVLADNAADRDQLVDVITYQNRKKIHLIDRSAVKTSSKYPPNLDYRGSPTINSVMYPEMVATSDDELALSKPKGGFRHNACVYIEDSKVQDMGQIHPHLHGAIVRSTFNIVGEVS